MMAVESKGPGAPLGTFREVIGVAWPIVVSMLSYTTMGLADTLMAAGLGTRAVAAIGIAMTASFAITAFGWGLMNGVKVAVAQAHGAGRPRRAEQAAFQGLGLAVAAGAAVLLFLPASMVILPLMGATGGLGEVAGQFFHVRLFGALPMYIGIAALGYFQGRGDTKTPMRLQVGANLLNILLAWLLIYGIGPFPALGVPGAALATDLALTVEAVVAIVWLCRATPERPAFSWAGTGAIARLGVPMGVRFALDVLSFAAFTGLVARVGEAQVAAHTIALRIISVSFLPGHGIGEAACVLTGQAVGAGDEGAARRVTRIATLLGLVTMGLCGVLFLTLSHPIVALFQPSADVLPIASSLLLIAAAFQVFDAVAMVKTGALNGAGDTRWVMAASVGSAWIVLLPLGYLLCNVAGWGAPGAWAALTAQIVILAGLYSYRWEGRWASSPSTVSRRASQAGPALNS